MSAFQGRCQFSEMSASKRYQHRRKLRILASQFSEYDMLDDDIGVIGKLSMRSIKWYLSCFLIRQNKISMEDFCFMQLPEIRVC